MTALICEMWKERCMTANPELLDRITVRADIFGGKPVIRDLRIAVEHGNARVR